MQQNHAEEPQAPVLKEYLRTIRRRLWVVVAVAVMLGLLGLGYSLARDPQYRATAQVLYQRNILDQLVVGAPILSSASPDREVATGAVLVSLQSLADSVASKLGEPGSGSRLLAKVATEAETGSDAIKILATSKDPREAASIANGFANALVDYRNATEQAKIGAAREVLQAQIDGLDGVEGSSGYVATLKGKVAGLSVLEKYWTQPFRVVGEAHVPTAALSRGPIPNTVLGLVVGAILGLVIAFVLEYFRPYSARKRQANQAVQLPHEAGESSGTP